MRSLTCWIAQIADILTGFLMARGRRIRHLRRLPLKCDKACRFYREMMAQQNLKVKVHSRLQHYTLFLIQYNLWLLLSCPRILLLRNDSLEFYYLIKTKIWYLIFVMGCSGLSDRILGLVIRIQNISAELFRITRFL